MIGLKSTAGVVVRIDQETLQHFTQLQARRY